MGTITPRIAAVDTWVPSDVGMLGWAFDPAQMAGGFASATGVIYLIRIPIRTPKVITNVLLFLGTIGATLTAGQSFAGLFAGQTAGLYTAGQQIGVTADQSVAWANAANANTYQAIPLVSGPFSISPATGWVWAAIVSNGTTPPTWGRGTNFNAIAINSNLSNASFRFATNGTGTALPASIVPSSNVSLQQELWAGLT